MKKILILAYTYPPDSRSGTFRILHFANQLARNKKFQPYILTVKDNCYEKGVHKDFNLISVIDLNVTVVRTGCLQLRDFIISLALQKNAKPLVDNHADNCKHKIKLKNEKVSLWQHIKDLITEDILSFPDRQVGWLPYVVLKAVRLIQKEKIDTILATGSPWSSFIAGGCVKLLTNVPLILDYRDPWTDNPFIEKERIDSRFHKLSKKLESRLVRYADAVILNTDSLRELFEKRFNSHGKFFTIHNGYRKQDILSDVPGTIHCQEDEFIFVHAGALYGHRSINNFLQAIKKIITAAFLGKTIKLKLIGVNAEVISQCKDILGEKLFMHHCVTMPRISHCECLAHMSSAHCLLLFQQGTTLQIPRKIFEYLALRKPIIAIITENGETTRLLEMCKAGLAVYDKEHDIHNAIVTLLRDYESLLKEIQTNSNYKEFEIKKLTGKLEKLLENIV